MRKPPQISPTEINRLKRGEITEDDIADPNLKGRKSARPYLERNVVRDEARAREIQTRALDFSDFQQIGLYDEEGLFERVVEFSKDTMPLTPQMLSPLFGKAIAEILFGCYVSTMFYHGPTPPTFLGLGAGRGYLDFDMIDHVTGEIFGSNESEYKEFEASFAKKSRFIVSDRTNRAFRYLQETLAPLVRESDLQDRVEVRQVDATSFRLDRKPYGIVYSNELLDNLTIEPIVDIDGVLYKVKIVPYTRLERPSEQIWTPGIDLEGFDGKALTKDGAMVLLRGDKTKVGYCPVFVPLSYDPELEAKARTTRSLGRAINTPDFGGLYPLQLKVGALLDSVRASFDHGLVLFADYTSVAEGTHNWNLATNHLRNYVFGEEDIDFQLDFGQVVEEGARRGFNPIYFEDQRKLLQQTFGFIEAFSERDYRRWEQVNSDIPINGDRAEACLKAYGAIFALIPHDMYKVLIMQF